MDRSNTVPTAIAFIVFVGLIIGGFIYLKNLVNSNREETQENTINDIGSLPDIQIKLNGIYYRAKPVISYATQNFMKKFPMTVQMSDESSNQKKGCVYDKFEGDSDKPKNAVRGDLLLYGDSCVVIVTSDFAAYGKYRKIGHIDNIDGLPDGSYSALFSEAAAVR